MDLNLFIGREMNWIYSNIQNPQTGDYCIFFDHDYENCSNYEQRLRLCHGECTDNLDSLGAYCCNKFGDREFDYAIKIDKEYIDTSNEFMYHEFIINFGSESKKSTKKENPMKKNNALMAGVIANKDGIVDGAKKKSAVEATRLLTELAKSAIPKEYEMYSDKVLDSFIGQVIAANMAYFGSQIFFEEGSKPNKISEEMIKGVWMEFFMKFGHLSEKFKEIMEKVDFPD